MPKKLTTEQFIEKARKVHGDKYDYSKVNYVNNHTKVCIICPEHGEFWQIPHKHLNGQECPECGKITCTEKRRLTNEEFIERAREIHDDKYNYSKVEYVNSKTPVCMICSVHGEFYQKPDSHLRGHGCPKCGNIECIKTKTYTQEEFIEKAKKVHGDKYDYSKVNYVNNHTKVCIICPEHGEFWQIPHKHLQGDGCKLCANEANGNRCRKSIERFIKEARQIHGDKYNYSKVEYVNSKTPVCMICSVHGEFYQKPDSHLRGHGCPKCGNIERIKTKTYTQEEFIEKAKKVHGDKYDYSKVNYVNNHTKVCIICPEHGEFWQSPNKHLQGGGCKLCANEANGNRCRKSIERFIERAREIHDDKYDYSKVKYKGANIDVIIICPEHGELWITPHSHLKGCGCSKCGRLRTTNARKDTTETFIEKAKKIHGDKYDYSKVKYIDTKTKVCIVCPEHGEFWQYPSIHFKGCGCPKCNQSRLENECEQYFKEHNIKYETQKSFEWLRYKNPLRLDFYLPEYNIAIECQGIQHFRPKEFFGGEDGFKSTVERDKIKKELCEEHNINIIYYTDIEDIPQDFNKDYTICNSINEINEHIF